MPRIYIVDDVAPNAFATGATQSTRPSPSPPGLLEKMNRVELEGVLAHELSHIKNYDILVSTLAVTLVGAIALISDIAIRMMWWNGGRGRRSQRQRAGPTPLAISASCCSPSPLSSPSVMQAASQSQTRVARRRQRRSR